MCCNQSNFISFTNVPESPDLDVPWDFQCLGCGKANQTPFEVNTCRDQLCGPCWQKSAYDLGDFENSCLICHKPTKLTCFKDYTTFVGFNFYNGDLILPIARLKEIMNYRKADMEDDGFNLGVEWIPQLLEAYLTHQIFVLDAIQKNIKKKFAWKNNHPDVTQKVNDWKSKSADDISKTNNELLVHDEETQFKIKDKSSKLAPQTKTIRPRRLAFKK